jgi:hypothetical protein
MQQLHLDPHAVEGMGAEVSDLAPCQIQGRRDLHGWHRGATEPERQSHDTLLAGRADLKQPRQQLAILDPSKCITARDVPDFVQGHDLNVVAGIKNLRHPSIIHIEALLSSPKWPAQQYATPWHKRANRIDYV